jgi:protein-tyrosine phosphatase
MTVRAVRRDGFADLHSHVLYGMDDGAKTRADSLKMLELAARSGTTDIVATPHANSRFRYDPAVIDEQIADLNASIEGIRIHRGCDFQLDVGNIEDVVANPRKYAVNGHAYLLVEFPHTLRNPHADRILKHLMDAGLTPILTHPERIPFLQTRIDDLARWVGNGCWLQLTAGSITGAFGRQAQRFSDALMSRGLVQVVASDAHDCTHRPPSLAEAYDALTLRYGVAAIKPLFVDNPRAVIAGERLDISVAPLKPLRRWFGLQA